MSDTWADRLRAIQEPEMDQEWENRLKVIQQQEAPLPTPPDDYSLIPPRVLTGKASEEYKDRAEKTEASFIAATRAKKSNTAQKSGVYITNTAGYPVSIFTSNYGNQRIIPSGDSI